jgi:hypothetical protein
MANTTQVKVTIPNPLIDFLSSKADMFGLTLSAYIKHLILNDVKDMEYPIYHASAQLEASYKKAQKEKEQAVEVTNVADFIAKL